MWSKSFFPASFWPESYWPAEGTAIEVCTYVPGSRNRFGTKRKFGTCLKFGDGFSDPWYPLNDADPAYDIEEGVTVVDRDDSTLLGIDNRNELHVDYEGVPDEVFYLQAPGGAIWRVTIDGTTGEISVEGGPDYQFVNNANLQLSLLEDLPWEPALPLDPGTIDLPDQFQLLWDNPLEGEGSVLSENPATKLIVSLDGELFKLTVRDTGELDFANDYETHTADTAFTPVFTEES